MRTELQKLYGWWTKKRPARKSPLDEYIGKLSTERKDETDKEWLREVTKFNRVADRHEKLEDKWDIEDQAMLTLLVQRRKWLWT